MSTGKQYPFFASRIFGTPLLIEPLKLQTILASIGDRFGLDVSDNAAPQARDVSRSEQVYAGYEVDGPVAVMPLVGTTMARGGYMSALSQLTSYTRIQQGIATALEDDMVERILLDVSSFGGEAEMCGETAAIIRRASGIKPVTAIAHDFAASAAFWLASAAGTFVATRSAEVGSAGVTMTHMSMEGAAKKAGVKITHIHAGAHKVDFSPYFDLKPEAEAEAQARIDDLYDQFTGSVAEYRGLSQQAVRDTEARMFGAEDAVRLGLADRIDTYENVLSKMRQGSVASTTEVFTMSDDIKTVAQLQEKYPTLCNEFRQAAVAVEQATAQAAIDTAVAAERDRIAAVQDHAEAEGREPLARQLAFTPGMTADMAGPILAAAEKKQAAASQPAEQSGISEFERAMAGEDPKVTAQAVGDGANPDNPYAELDALLDAQDGNQQRAN